MMKKVKKKIIRNYTDFYTAEDLRDPDTPQKINLTIEDFDAKGQIGNPRAPCVVTTVDPNYIKYASQQRIVKKFRMKTDILRLREITRKKFMIYSTQQRYLEKQREAEFHDQEYKRIKEFYEFADESLNKIESQAFSDMMQTNEKLEALKKVKVADELKAITAEHQRILMDVQDIYRRFLFLLKLIGYFDDIEDCSQEKQNVNKSVELHRPRTITELCIDNDSHVNEQIKQIKEYMDQVVRPYLAQKNHMKADLWLEGYEQTRRKIFNYNRHLTHVALLNHIVAIVDEKFKKTYARRTAKLIFLRDPNFLEKRVAALQLRANNTLNDFEKHYREDRLNLRLNGIIPVILEEVEGVVGKSKDTEINSKLVKVVEKPSSASSTYNEQMNTLSKVEKIHNYLMNLLHEFDTMPPEMCKQIEQQVRRRKRIENEKSRRALVNQTRLYNWMAHFRKHEQQKPK